jgi:hypothetical protein
MTDDGLTNDRGEPVGEGRVSRNLDKMSLPIEIYFKINKESYL